MRPAMSKVLTWWFALLLLVACAPPLASSPERALPAPEIYRRVSPAVAFIETPAATGSGAVLAERYVVTNAHVVWPFTQARVVFADGAEFADAPVANWDLLADLAVIGPLDLDVAPLPMVNGERLPIGSDIYLIGYPGESDLYPQPAITRGILARTREWRPASLTYFQGDITIIGGQSGGVMVDGHSAVIGVSGFSFDVGFALAASITDLAERVEALLAEEARMGEGPPAPSGELDISGTLPGLWSTRAYLIDAEPGETITLTAESENDLAMFVSDLSGYTVEEVDGTTSGEETLAVTVDYNAPFFLVLYQLDPGAAAFSLAATHPLIPFPDREDGRALAAGEEVLASLDHAADVDDFLIDLRAEQVIEVFVDSMLIDPQVELSCLGCAEVFRSFDDDSGGGLFGVNARLIYRAPETATYLLRVSPFQGGEVNVGGYFLAVDEAPAGAVPAPYESEIEDDGSLPARERGKIG